MQTMSLQGWGRRARRRPDLQANPSPAPNRRRSGLRGLPSTEHIGPQQGGSAAPLAEIHDWVPSDAWIWCPGLAIRSDGAPVHISPQLHLLVGAASIALQTAASIR